MTPEHEGLFRHRNKLCEHFTPNNTAGEGLEQVRSHPTYKKYSYIWELLLKTDLTEEQMNSVVEIFEQVSPSSFTAGEEWEKEFDEKFVHCEKRGQHLVCIISAEHTPQDLKAFIHKT